MSNLTLSEQLAENLVDMSTALIEPLMSILRIKRGKKSSDNHETQRLIDRAEEALKAAVVLSGKLTSDEFDAFDTTVQAAIKQAIIHLVRDAESLLQEVPLSDFVFWG